MSDIFREVDEDVRKERYGKLWKAYGRYIIAAVTLIILGTVAGVSWTSYQKSVKEGRGDRFAAALVLARDGSSEQAADAFAALADDAGGGVGALARLQQAAALIEAGDSNAAIDAYDMLAEDGSADRLLRDLARLLAAMNSLDNASTGELTDRLAPLIRDDNAFRYSARELQALVSYRAGDVAGALSQLRALSDDPEAPPGLRQRAAEMIIALGGV
ncbi:MAG: tetratricopeptide repeat protein [Proteobacteria bacterium]|nr:tetratricopeptide repeat protein [Pseudomonadota bacterium]